MFPITWIGVLQRSCLPIQFVHGISCITDIFKGHKCKTSAIAAIKARTRFIAVVPRGNNILDNSSTIHKLSCLPRIASDWVKNHFALIQSTKLGEHLFQLRLGDLHSHPHRRPHTHTQANRQCKIHPSSQQSQQQHDENTHSVSQIRDVEVVARVGRFRIDVGRRLFAARRGWRARRRATFRAFFAFASVGVAWRAVASRRTCRRAFTRRARGLGRVARGVVVVAVRGRGRAASFVRHRVSIAALWTDACGVSLSMDAGEWRSLHAHTCVESFFLGFFVWTATHSKTRSLHVVPPLKVVVAETRRVSTSPIEAVSGCEQPIIADKPMLVPVPYRRMQLRHF